MDDVLRLLILLGIAGAALTLIGGVAIWFMDETRRIRRSLKRVLGGEAHAWLVAHGRGRGVGFNLATNLIAVTWDAGAWCLIYRIDELIGCEVIADGQVAGRVYRGEARRALDSLGGAEQRVTLRMVFNDPAHPDFPLELWLPEDEDRRNGLLATEALAEANRWLARVEALLRRPLPVSARATPAPPPIAPPAVALPILADEDGDEEDEASEPFPPEDDDQMSA